MVKIAIIGAGITGTTTAFSLLEKGHEVVVFDRHPYAAMETSYANGGQLSASNAEVWNNWSTVIKGLRWLFRRDAPLSLRLSPTWHKYSWLAEFLWAIRNHRDNTITTTRIAIAAREHLLRMADVAAIDFNLEKRGILHLYHTPSDFEKALIGNRLLEEGGLERRPVTDEEIHAIEPSLAGRFHGGLYTPSDFTGDVHKFTRGLMEYCQRKGALFVHNAEVSGISASDRGVEIVWSSLWPSFGVEERLPFDATVICAGVGSRSLAGLVGDRINVYPVKGYSITVQLEGEESQNTGPWVSLLDESAKIVTSRLGADRFRVAGTAEFSGMNRDIRMDRVNPLVEWVRRLFPDMNTSKVVPWAGLRPMMPDMMPRVGPGKHKRVFYNTGHGHLGWTMSAATADLAATLISETV